MPYDSTWENNGFIRSFYGEVDTEEVFESDREFYEDPRSDTARFQITDFSRGIPGNIEVADVTKIAGFDLGASLSIPNLKVAFVTKDPYVKTLCEQYIELLNAGKSTWKFKIFEDVQGAKGWVLE